MRLRTARILAPLVLCVCGVQSAIVAGNAAGVSSGTQVTGTVTAAGQPLSGASVTLYDGDSRGVSPLAKTTTGANGGFSLAFSSPPLGVLYVAAQGGKPTRSPSPVPAALRLLSVVGVLGGGGVTVHTLSAVTVNELTTVATTYALAQFLSGSGISGPSPGLENAAATVSSLVNLATGQPGPVVTDSDNGARNSTLATLNTLSSLVQLCASRARPARCGSFLALSTPAGSPRPINTVEAIENLAKNPTLSPAKLWGLAGFGTAYRPVLSRPPTAWILALLYTDTGLYASGRVAIDSTGNVWSNNNWVSGTTNPSKNITVLNPLGTPIFGSPISGGGIDGTAYGNAVALNGTVWFGNAAGNSVSQFSASGVPLSPSSGWTNGGLHFPQTVAVDQKGNVWIANNYGPESAPNQGDVVVYPRGNPAKAITITGGGLNHPFSIQIDGQGRAWVTNEGLGGAKLVNTKLAFAIGKFGGSVTVIGPNFKVQKNSPLESTSFKLPLGLALDQGGYAWVVNYFGSTVTQIAPSGAVARVVKLPGHSFGWGDAVDGSGRVWVAGFSRPGVWLICGAETASCPKGSRTGSVLSPRSGFTSSAMQHLTSIQIDQSGNIWLSNNWSKILTGGVGIVELIGMATPVCTPLVGLPKRPSTTTACPGLLATATAASGG